MVDPNEHDRFVVRQKLTLVTNLYSISVDEDRPLAYVRQKPFAFKEELHFTAEPGTPPNLMVMKARQRWDPSATYDVTDETGRSFGIVKKQFGKSLLRSTWTLQNAQGEEVATAHERKMWVALFRRLVGFVPYIGNFADWLPIPYDFVFFRGEQELGVFRRRRGSFRDTYDLDLSADTGRTLDRRLVLAVAVGLDALQAR